MKYVYLLIGSIFFLSCSDAPPPQFVENSKDIQAIIDERLLGSIEAINSIFAIITAIFTLMLVVAGYMSFNIKKQKEEISSEIEYRLNIVISKKFKEQEEEIYEEINQKTKSIIKNTNKKIKNEFQKEEFLRNMLLNDLNKMRATQQQNSENIAQAFSDHVDRYNVVSQLTSGIKDEQTKALRKLSTGVYKKIIKLQSFKNFIEFLKDSDIDLDMLAKISQLELNI